MWNESAQWIFIIVLVALNAVIFLTNLDEKWDLLRPRYGRVVAPKPEQKKRRGGRRRGTR